MEKHCTQISEIKHEGTKECITAHEYLLPFLIGNVRAVELQFNFSLYSHVQNCKFCINARLQSLAF